MKKVVSEMYRKAVRSELYEGSALSHGNKSYIVKAMCTTAEDSEPHQREFAVQASSPEEAKKGAMLQASEMDLKCSQVSVDMVPNSDEELNNYGSGKDLGAEPSDQTSGKVKPSDVSKGLPNHDA